MPLLVNKSSRESWTTLPCRTFQGSLYCYCRFAHVVLFLQFLSWVFNKDQILRLRGPLLNTDFVF